MLKNCENEISELAMAKKFLGGHGPHSSALILQCTSELLFFFSKFAYRATDRCMTYSG